MSDVCGIFQKRCPQCAAAVAKSAAHCVCGYSFDTETPASGIAQSLAEEKLYEDYLNARVMQTAQAAIEAKAVQQTRLDDPAAMAAALAALEEAEAARRDLSVQSARVEELRQAMVAEAGGVTQIAIAASDAESASAAVRAPVAIIESPQLIAPVSARAAEVARAAEALRAELAKLRHDSGKPARVVQLIKTARGTQTAALAQSKVAEVPKRTCTQCQASVLASAKRCRCGFSFVAEGSSAESAHVPKIEEVLARAEDIKKSRRESAQAEKAERIRQARLARAAERSKATTPAGATAPLVQAATADAVAPSERASLDLLRAESSAPRGSATNALLPGSGSASRARIPTSTARPNPVHDAETAVPKVSVAPTDARSPAAPPTANVSSSIQHLSVCIAPARPIATVTARDTKECPNCTASLATTTMRCKCGFEFRSASGGSPMPGLSLDAGELIKVRDLYVRR